MTEQPLKRSPNLQESDRPLRVASVSSSAVIGDVQLPDVSTASKRKHC